MKFISWNVNGLRACNRKNHFVNYVKEEHADFVALQETKYSYEGQINLKIEGYHDFWHCSQEKKGYSGTAIFSKYAPLDVTYGIDDIDTEGRVITLEFDKFYLVNCYTPNSQMNMERLNFRMEWNELFEDYVGSLNNKKDTIVCGDLNVAHKDIDVCEKFRGKRRIGFTPEERYGFEDLLRLGFIDSFRYLNPDEEKFSWWLRNRPDEDFMGCRLDYFLVSSELKNKLIKSDVCTEITGSDHCPVLLELDIDVIE